MAKSTERKEKRTPVNVKRIKPVGLRGCNSHGDVTAALKEIGH